MVEEKNKNSLRYIPVEMWRPSYEEERFLEMDISVLLQSFVGLYR